jgi:hypothetical protein
MATPKTSAEFKIKGPVFQKPLKLAEAVNRGLLDLATIEGSNKVKEQLYPGHGLITGNLRNHIGASIVRDFIAQVDAGEERYGRNLIYAAWVEGVSPRNKKSVFKGYHMFENAYNHINNNPKLFDDYIGDALVEALD